MKDVVMAAEWRTVQLFLGDNGVCEVEVDSNDPKKIRCNCKGEFAASRCAHVKHVREIMTENNGHYTISIPSEIDEDEAIVAMTDPNLFRDFIIKYGKVEVL